MSKDSLIDAANDKSKESKRSDDVSKSMPLVDEEVREEPVLRKRKSEHKTDIGGERSRDRDRDREKDRDREREKERLKARERERGRDSDREREREDAERDREKVRDRTHRSKDRGKDLG